jgi:hypothetical protein
MVRHSTDQVVKAVKSRYTGKGAGMNIATDMKALMSLMNTEEKHIDTIQTAVSVVNSGSQIIGLGTMAQGTTSSTRTGDSIKVIRIDLLMAFTFSSGTTATSTVGQQTFNWYLVRYLKTPSTSGTSSFGIAEFLNQDPGNTYTPLSLTNTDTNQNFQLMGSGQVNIQLQAIPATTFQVTKVVELSHPCSFHQDYSGASASTITNNMVFLVVTALNASNTGGTSTVQFSERMMYVDN